MNFPVKIIRILDNGTKFIWYLVILSNFRNISPRTEGGRPRFFILLYYKIKQMKLLIFSVPVPSMELSLFTVFNGARYFSEISLKQSSKNY